MISKLIEKNKSEDIERFFKERKCLNKMNCFLMYLFHFIQSSGIIVTSYAAGTHDSNLVWIGISLNTVASLLMIYEKQNNNLLEKLLINIKNIENGKYIDEETLVDVDVDKTN